jgi:hypothetical protein
MPAFLRNITNPKWVRPAWSTDEDIPADALTDLRSTNNELSVWAITTEVTDVSLALTAFASARANLDKLDYVLIDEGIPQSVSIRVDTCEGLTPCSSANHLHRNLAQLTVRKVSSLAVAIMALDKKRVTEKQVKTMLVEALNKGALDRNRVNPKLLSQLEHS